MNHFVEFLEDHDHLYGEQNYKIKETVKPEDSSKETVKIKEEPSKLGSDVSDDERVPVSIIEIKAEEVQGHSVIIQNNMQGDKETVELVDERFR